MLARDKECLLLATKWLGVRTLNQRYSIVSRMEAVYVRDECLKLHTRCGHLKKPVDIVRHLEDETS